MFDNKKVNYIFVSLENEIIPNHKISGNITYLQKILKKFSKTKKITQEANTNALELSKKMILEISKYTDKKCFSFFLNLENTHDQFIEEIQSYTTDRYYVFPLYPQYRSELNLIANFFSLNLYDEITSKFFWIKSFHNHPYFIKAIQKNIKTIIKRYSLDEKDIIFLFLADKYENNLLYSFECEITCQNIIKTFQFIEGDFCFLNENIQNQLSQIKINTRKKIIIIPITTLIDDCNTNQKIKLIKSFLEKQQKDVFISKTLNHNLNFIRSILNIIDEKSFVSNKMLTSLN